MATKGKALGIKRNKITKGGRDRNGGKKIRQALREENKRQHRKKISSDE